jgi:hypothetical protein
MSLERSFPVLEAISQSSLRRVDADIGAIHVNRCHPTLERRFGVPEQVEWRIAKSWGLIVRRDRQVDRGSSDVSQLSIALLVLSTPPFALKMLRARSAVEVGAERDR